MVEYNWGKISGQITQLNRVKPLEAIPGVIERPNYRPVALISQIRVLGRHFCGPGGGIAPRRPASIEVLLDGNSKDQKCFPVSKANFPLFYMVTRFRVPVPLFHDLPRAKRT